MTVLFAVVTTLFAITIFNLAYYANVKKWQVEELKRELVQQKRKSQELKRQLAAKPVTKYDRTMAEIEAEGLWAKF